MEILTGSSAFPGIAVGKIHYYYKGKYQIRQYLSSNEQKEIRDFEEALTKVIGNLRDPEAKTGEEDPELSAEHERLARLLEGKSFREAVEEVILQQKVRAPYAVNTIVEELIQHFGMLESEAAVQRISDVRKVTGYLLEALGGFSEKIDLGSEPMILATDKLSVTELMEMDREKVLAIVTNEGSEISHTAIFAKSIGIPSIFGLQPDEDWDGQTAIVDGFSGILYLSPDEDELKEYSLRKSADEKEREELMSLRDQENVTPDGRIIGLFANIGGLGDLTSALYYGATGIGLLRSEFQYLGRDNYPSEEELFSAYKKAAEVMGSRLCVIRTADLGADKRTPYLNLPEEKNPVMGNRGIRLSLDRPDMLKRQLRALYRASVYGNLALMLPMITSLSEVEEAETLMLDVKEELRESRIDFREMKVGIMIETPAAVMLAEELSAYADFISLGTNDLTQYTLAMDRQNPALRNKYDAHHPAVLRMIKMVVEAAHKKRKPVCICGELAADTSMTETFLQLGVDALSVVPACILPVRKVIRGLA